MRVAIVDHSGSVGGVARFMLALVEHLGARYPSDTYDFYARSETIRRDRRLGELVEIPNVSVLSIDELQGESSTPSQETLGAVSPAMGAMIDLIRRNRWTYSAAMTARSFIRERIQGRSKPWFKMSLSPDVQQRLDGYDVVYFVWPFFLEPVSLRSAALVGTFHDLHYKHFPHDYNPERLRVVERQTPVWLERCDVVATSTRFMADEIECYYPGLVREHGIVYIAPYSYEHLPAEQVSEIVREMGIEGPFILYSGGRSAHKNILGLVKALPELRRRGVTAPLVITGTGTDVIANPNAHVARTDPAYAVNEFMAHNDLRPGVDVRSFGYITNEQVDALTRAAAVVASASLYEAGCGPALDAWQFGAPVAFSDIPPFVEQLDALDTEAWVFDPTEPASIAEQLHGALTDVECAKAMADRSREAISRYTWNDVARGYHAVFERAIQVKRERIGR